MAQFPKHRHGLTKNCAQKIFALTALKIGTMLKLFLDVFRKRFLNVHKILERLDLLKEVRIKVMFHF